MLETKNWNQALAPFGCNTYGFNIMKIKTIVTNVAKRFFTKCSDPDLFLNIIHTDQISTGANVIA